MTNMSAKSSAIPTTVPKYATSSLPGGWASSFDVEAVGRASLRGNKKSIGAM